MAERAIHPSVYSSLSQRMRHPFNRQHISRNAVVHPVALGVAQHILGSSDALPSQAIPAFPKSHRHSWRYLAPPIGVLGLRRSFQV